LNIDFKLIFKYILLNSKKITLKYFKNKNKNIVLYANNLFFYYLMLHFKLSTNFYSTQLVDIFSYEIPLNKNLNSNKDFKKALTNTSLIVYQFHSILNNQRFFLFIDNSNFFLNKNFYLNYFFINSITELFLNANWLEREVSELHGIFFFNKKDVRNLLLQYGDTTAPMKKSFPSIGLREVFYDSSTDLIIQNPVSIQF